MSESALTASQQFELRNGPEGRFLRYARGRLQGFMLRQTLTLLGALTIAAVGSVTLGVLALVIALLGEIVDCLVLKANLKPPLSAIGRKWCVVSAGFQAVTISVCVIITWRGIALAEARFFAAAFLMSGAINAGMVRWHFPEAGFARLLIYGLVLITMVIMDLTAYFGTHATQSVLFLFTVMILVYTATLFIASVEKGQRARLKFERALLVESVALEASRRELAQEGKKLARLALVAKHAHDSIILTAPNGRIEWVNEAFTAAMGYSFEEVVGKFPGDVLNAPETSYEALEILHKAQRDRLPCRLEIQNQTKSGKLVWIEISMVPILNPDGTPDVFVAIERDISQAKAHEKELAVARSAAEMAAQAKSQFLATMSHEIRTPMNGVIGVAELLEETRLDQNQRQLVATIVESARALLTIINDVLDLSKLQAGKVELRQEAFVLRDLITSSVDLLRPTAMKKGLALSWQSDDAAVEYVGDAGRLRQIILNLLGNALKFTAQGSITLNLTTTRHSDYDTVSLGICDTGIGIAPDRLGQVFESFAQADNTISRQFGGTGLGLTISRMLAQQMQGDITVSSILGQGSVFTLNVSIKRAVEMTNQSNVVKRAPPRTKLRVLIAEDNRTNMMIARKMLAPCVADLKEAVNGREAVDMFSEIRPDLVLMDVSMAQMDGITATRAIRAVEGQNGWPRTIIVALTAYSQPKETKHCLDAGMDLVLTKPLVRADLYDLLESIKTKEIVLTFPPDMG